MPGNKVHFNLHSLTYSAGDWIKGEINLKLESELPSPHLSLTLSCTESVVRKSPIPASIQHKHLNYTINLFKSPDTLPQGDYVFPFEILLPKTLPTSTSIDTAKVKIDLTYTLSTQLCSIESTSVDIIIQSLQDFPTSQNRTDTIVDIKSCFCLKKTSIDFEASIKKYAYNCNEIIKCSIEGMCEKMPSVEIYLIRNLMTRLNGEILVEKEKLCVITTDMESLDIDLKAFEGRLKDQTSSRGMNFSCSYSLVVVGLPQAICFRERPELLLWVVINPVPRSSPIPKYSGSWRPRKMNTMRYEDININTEN